jgi:chromosome segregation ATPase
LKSTNSAMSEKIAGLEGDVKGLGKENSQLKASNSQLSDSLKKGQGENEGLKKQLGQMGEKIAGLEGQVKGLGKENSQLKAANGQLGDALKKGQGESEGLKKQLGEMGDKVAGLEGQVKGLGKENGQLKAANGQLGEALKRGQGENEGLKKQLGEMGDKVAGLEGQVKGLGKENGQLKAANGQLGDALKKGQGENEGLKKQLGEMGDKVAGLEGQVKGLSGENGKLQKSGLAKDKTIENLGKELAQQKALAKDLQDTLGTVNRKYASLQDQFTDTDQKKTLAEKLLNERNADNQKLAKDLDTVKSQLLTLANQNRKTEDDLKNTQKDRNNLEKRLAVVTADNDDLKNKATDLGQKLSNLTQTHNILNHKLNQTEKAQVACETEKTNTKEQQKKLAMAVGAQEKKLHDVASTLQEARKAVQEIDSERKRIAGSIANNLRASGVEVDINPETGNITLRMDDSFYFKNNSYELRDEAKQKISRIMPVYAQSLLGTPRIANRIEKILVTGYASPKFNKTYVDPAQAVGEPYEYNLDLSLNRAREIVAYMFGTEISQYPYKDQMRGMVNVAGMGLMEAMPLEKDSICLRDPKAGARLEECTCGPYDCKRSRRVEIQFVLRNQKDTERQLQKISDKLNERGATHVSH